MFNINSGNFSTHESRDMGLKKETEVSILLGLGMGTIREVFHAVGSVASRKQWLKSASSQA
jgi:hypothetical protein